MRLAAKAEKRMSALEAAEYLPEPEDSVPEEESNVRRGDTAVRCRNVDVGV